MIDTMTLLWDEMSDSPVLWITLTLAAYHMGVRIFRRLGERPLFHPVLTAVILLAVLLRIGGVDYYSYFNAARFIHFLLGPATVALAIPLYHEIDVIRKASVPIAATLAIGSLTGIISAVGMAWVLGSEKIILLTLAPKSVTTPIAIGIAEQIGGVPALTAVTVVLTGIAGAVLGDAVLNALNITDEAARGMALGIASHGIGTAHAIQKNRIAGAFAALAMALNGLCTALVLGLWAALT